MKQETIEEATKRINANYNAFMTHYKKTVAELEKSRSAIVAYTDAAKADLMLRGVIGDDEYFRRQQETTAACDTYNSAMAAVHAHSQMVQSN